MADVVELAQALLRCRSVTPADDGAQAVLAAALTASGFAVTRLEFGGIENLYAERATQRGTERGTGRGGAKLCFAGHTDVVPPGDAAWTHDPFAGGLRDGVLYGRGACDMKGAIAAFVAAAAQAPAADLSLLITGDEEGEAVNGTVKVLEWMRAHGKRPEFCVVGEPTSKARLGDQIKIGRRGSLNARVTVRGRQGHVAYPALADNPVHRLMEILHALAARRLDQGTEWFEPSCLQITSVDVGNPAANVIPATAAARLNIRFNDLHSEASLTRWLRETVAAHAPDAAAEIKCSGEAFLTPPGAGAEMLTAAIAAVTGIAPARDTSGGTSDARFIARHFPVVEFGLVGATMHQADEAVAADDLLALTRIYGNLIGRFCG